MNANQSDAPIKEPIKQLRWAIYYLNMLKKQHARFMNSEIHNETFHSILSSDLKELNELTEHTKELCKRWIQKKNLISDSETNRIIFKNLLILSFNIRNAIFFIRNTIINKNVLASTLKIFTAKSKNLKNRIVEIKKLIKNLKTLGIEKLLENVNSENKLVDNTKRRYIKFLYQEENASTIKNLKIFIGKRFYLALTFSVFEESLFLCVCNSNQYLKIIIMDLKTKNRKEIDKYTVIEDKNNINFKYFGFGSKHTILRSGSKGQLFILKSSLKKPFENRGCARNSFELLVVDKEYRELASIKVDSNASLINSFQSAIIDFIVHNDYVYALDMNCRCVKIFNEYLVLLKTIPIPKISNEIQDIHLAVSSKYILIAASTTIYYILNNDQYSEFKKLDLGKFILNIACYDEEHAIVRLINRCYSFKIRENLSEIKFTHLTSLDKLRYLSLDNFMVKDNFVHSICKKTSQIFRINLTLNSLSE